MVFHEHGDSSVLRREEVADPHTADDAVLVAVRACAINGLDIYAREGGLEESTMLPHICGADIAGEVVHVGALAEPSVELGDRVVINPRSYCGRCLNCLRGEQTGCVEYSVLGWHRPGGYGELVAVPATHLARIPAHLSYVEAAAVPMVFTTAWRMLFGRVQVRPGEVVLILGASGGVATASVQLAKSVGAQVIAVTSADKANRVSALGVDAVLTYDDPSLQAHVDDLTDGRGVDVLVQTQGGATWRQGLEMMARFGRIVLCAAVRGTNPIEDLGMIWWKQLTIVGSTGGTPVDFANVMAALERRAIHPLVSATYSIAEAAQAQDAFTGHSHVGKVVLEH